MRARHREHLGRAYEAAVALLLILVFVYAVVLLLDRMKAMNSTAFVILTGVVSGVVTTVLLVGMTVVFRKVIRPSIEEFIYRGINLEGEWKVTGWNAAQVTKLDLIQHAWRLSGTCSFVAQGHTNTHPYEHIRTFTVRGTVNERLVELSFRHADKARLGAGVWLFEVVGDGRQMKGIQVQYSISSVGRGVTHCNVVALRPGTPAADDMKGEDLDSLTAEELELLQALSEKKGQVPDNGEEDTEGILEKEPDQKSD